MTDTSKTDWRAAWERCRHHAEKKHKQLNAAVAERDALSAERDALRQQVKDLSAQPYVYIGKDGKSALARDLEDERDALSARVAELEAARPEMVAEVKPLVWYGKPNNQEMRIGRCGQVAYSVQFKMGRWGYTRDGDTGHICGFKGCRLFETEADAVNGADLDHAERVRQTITITPKAEAIREGMERAAKIASVMAPDDLCEVPDLIRKAMEDV